MIIGFFTTDLQSLSFFKKIVTQFPLHGYIFYCDTEHSQNKKHSIEKGLSFLHEKGCRVVVVENIVVAETVVGMEFDFLVHTVPTIEAYLEHAQQEESLSTERIVHLTQHTEVTDKQVAQILGGYFIAQ